jgi:hypothetical protein
MRCLRRALVQQRLQTARRPFEEEGFDSGGHVSFLSHQSSLSIRLVQSKWFGAKDVSTRRKVDDLESSSFALFTPFAVRSFVV